MYNDEKMEMHPEGGNNEETFEIGGRHFEEEDFQAALEQDEMKLTITQGKERVLQKRGFIENLINEDEAALLANVDNFVEIKC